MVLAAWCPNEVALYGRYECALSQVGSHPNMTLDVARTQNNNEKRTISHLFLQPPRFLHFHYALQDVLARPDQWGKYDHVSKVCISFRLSTDLCVVQLPVGC